MIIHENILDQKRKTASTPLFLLKDFIIWSWKSQFKKVFVMDILHCTNCSNLLFLFDLFDFAEYVEMFQLDKVNILYWGMCWYYIKSARTVWFVSFVFTWTKLYKTQYWNICKQTASEIMARYVIYWILVNVSCMCGYPFFAWNSNKFHSSLCQNIKKSTTFTSEKRVILEMMISKQRHDHKSLKGSWQNNVDVCLWAIIMVDVKMYWCRSVQIGILNNMHMDATW